MRTKLKIKKKIFEKEKLVPLGKLEIQDISNMVVFLFQKK